MRTRSAVWSLVLAGGLAIATLPAPAVAGGPAPSPAPAQAVVVAPAATSVPANVSTSRTPKGRLVLLPLVNKTYALTSGWGPRCIPTRGATTFHYGLDMGAADGAPVYAVTGGVVTDVRQPSGGAPGTIVVRSLVDGVPTWLGYLHPWNPGKYVKVGDKVKAGQRIADVGASGPATGPHLHLEVWTGGYYTGTSHDPRAWLEGYGLPVTAQATADRVAPTPSSCTYYSTTRLNLRAGASTSTTVLATLDANTRLWNKPGTKINGFIPVSVRMDASTVLRGWVHTDYISQSKAYHLATSTVVRSSAVSTSKALYTAPAGARVAPGRVSGWWTNVSVNGVTGWVPTSAIAGGVS
ncbi:M23 family metallopeptidase [Cellulomonas sp. DKR-3]|uniref:M23 family metallopeptidase n=1 Tax=Cellulomonas fulva TaxID=2835530 RepID=A0ABS5TY60_9CELL|nr:M23 family metallopeptidase [Cellulomonas fulva]MBT0994084.1 M23 family metallopeptidase [Cellulomonas fulva]